MELLAKAAYSLPNQKYVTNVNRGSVRVCLCQNYNITFYREKIYFPFFFFLHVNVHEHTQI